MPRTRNIRPWKQPNYAFNSLSEFSAAPRTHGLLTIRHNRDYLDFLVVDNKSDTTLVVFSGALSLAAQHTPAFSGIGISKDTGVNLIAVADPSMSQGEITVAWYLGNSTIGPIKSLISDAISHIIKSIGSTNTIIFGGSGGGYAAAHIAYNFPGCTAFIFNPRLNIDKWSKGPLTRYFKFALKSPFSGELSQKHIDELEPYGPVRISDLATSARNHTLLIYQNLLDSNFLEFQLLPFMADTLEDDKVLYRFDVDGVGHIPIPAEKVREIILSLAAKAPREINYATAGFQRKEKVLERVLRQVSMHARSNEPSK